MGSKTSETSIQTAMDQILGYLNFSSGSHDANFFANLNLLFDACTPANCDPRHAKAEKSLASSKQGQVAHKVRKQLEQRLVELADTDTFRDAGQAEAVLKLTFDHLLPAYRKHHRDLLFHQTDQFLCNSFFLGRAFETVLQQGAPWDREKEIVASALQVINDFIGHRPVAALESQKIEPYQHEWIRPVPIFVRGAGVAAGPYCEITQQALEILKETHPDILIASQFEPERLDELAIDPRAFDFDHPINKRPNHHFGQWDEHSIDGSGYFRRFIIHQVTLDSLLERIESANQNTKPGQPPIDPAELMREASAVLAGTMLMASAISGSGPGCYDSNTTLTDLLPLIAGFRDQFYEFWLQKFSPAHRKRLEREAKTRQQPFGAVRQDLNARLAQRRASQLVNCRLASIFARMGYQHAAEQQSHVVPVAAARINCQIDCLLNAASRAISHGDLDAAFKAIPATMGRLKRGIHCGAIVDPWNILGFDANYSLFPAIENTVSDHRVYDLVDAMDRIFALCSRLWSEAAASDRREMCESIRKEFLAIVQWWRQYAAHEVMSVDAVDALEIFQAAELVAEALNLWHKGGAEAGDINFWAQHAELFDSPKAYALVVDALMQRRDFKTSTALLINWLSQADEIPLQMGDSSFHDLVYHWISEQRNLFRIQQDRTPEKAALMQLPKIAQIADQSADQIADQSADQGANQGNGKTASTDRGEAPSPDEVWDRIRKFYDFIEANAEHYWDVPRFQFNGKSVADTESLDEDIEGFDELDDLISDEDGDDLFSAAYDDVVYNDTTDDGFDGEVFDGSLSSDDAVEAEVERVLDRLEFLSTVASYWAIGATIPLPVSSSDLITDEITARLSKRRSIVTNWVKQAVSNREKLNVLLKTVNKYPLPTGGSDHDAMLHYDQHRLYKDTLLDQAIHTCIETENAVRMLLAVIRAIDFLMDGQPLLLESSNSSFQAGIEIPLNGTQPLVNVFAAILLQDSEQVEENFNPLTRYLLEQSLLYVPISKGGDPEAIVKARVLQIAILELLRHLPAIGLLEHTFELTRTALVMERSNPIGQGAVTEFDELFEVAFTSMVHTLVQSANQFKVQSATQAAKAVQDGSEGSDIDPKEFQREASDVLFDCIEKLTGSMLALWLNHSRTLRLSVLERISDRQSWERLVDFIKTYGAQLFTQHFLHLGNIRAILHQGVDRWLSQVQESPNVPDLRLFDELDRAIPRQKAVRYLTLVLESVIENYNEYRDFNTTTTQSDQGELLYTLLDFLRLRSSYDRVCWKLKPVVWAHRILVNDQENGVARMWRRSLTEKVSAEADKYLDRMERLRNRYSMRMESIGRRLEGRFGHQIQIDRLRALVAPAMRDPQSHDSIRKFEMLQHQAQAFSRSTIVVGIDLPAWLAALENEVEQYHLPGRLKEQSFIQQLPDTVVIPIADLQKQIEQLPNNEDGMF